MEDAHRHFLLNGDLIENLAEDFLSELIEENFCSGASVTASTLNDMDLWSFRLYRVWPKIT